MVYLNDILSIQIYLSAHFVVIKLQIEPIYCSGNQKSTISIAKTESIRSLNNSSKNVISIGWKQDE
jgi:hypothetical protein